MLKAIVCLFFLLGCATTPNALVGKPKRNPRDELSYQYIDTVRLKMDSVWQKELKEDIKEYYQIGQRLESGRKFIVHYQVTLDKNGGVVELNSIEKSPYLFLNESVEKTLKQLQFDPPPKGILDSEEKVKIRWDYILKT